MYEHTMGENIMVFNRQLYLWLVAAAGVFPVAYTFSELMAG